MQDCALMKILALVTGATVDREIIFVGYKHICITKSVQYWSPKNVVKLSLEKFLQKFYFANCQLDELYSF